MSPQKHRSFSHWWQKMKVGAVRFKVQEFNALLLALKKEVLSATKFGSL